MISLALRHLLDDAAYFFRAKRHLEAGRASVCLANRSIASSTSKQVEKPSRAIDATKRAVNCSPRFSSDGVDQRVE